MPDGPLPGRTRAGAGSSWAAALADLVVPLECAGCGRPRQRWCAECDATLTGPLLVVRTRADLRVPVWALTGHSGPASRAVSAYKDRGRSDLARPFGVALAAGLDQLRAAGELPEPGERPTVLVPAPASGRARRRRGFDHVREIVDVLAADLAGSLPSGPVAVAPLLEVRGRVRDASGLGAQARSDNLSGRIRRRSGRTSLRASPGAPATVAELLAGPSTVVLVDDVVTTGATAAECVGVLESGGLRVAGVLALTAA